MNTYVGQAVSAKISFDSLVFTYSGQGNVVRLFVNEKIPSCDAVVVFTAVDIVIFIKQSKQTVQMKKNETCFERMHSAENYELMRVYN